MARAEPRGEPPMETRPSSAAGRARAGAPPAPPPSSSRGTPRPDSGLPGELVFQGSAERDVALAKLFWGSVTLQPPLESRLGPRREPHRSSASLLAGPPSSPSCALRRSQLLDRGSFYSQGSLAEKKGSLHSQGSAERKGSFFSQGSFIDGKEEEAEKPLDPDRAHEKQKYLQKAKRREEILALLRKRREERLMKEVISERHKPRSKPQESKVKISDTDLEDQESVKALP